MALEEVHFSGDHTSGTSKTAWSKPANEFSTLQFLVGGYIQWSMCFLTDNSVAQTSPNTTKNKKNMTLKSHHSHQSTGLVLLNTFALRAKTELHRSQVQRTRAFYVSSPTCETPPGGIDPPTPMLGANRLGARAYGRWGRNPRPLGSGGKDLD